MTPASTEVLATETLAEAMLAALREPQLASVVERMLERWLLAAPVAVPFREAAAELDVTVPTVAAWVERGALEEVHGRRPRAVTGLSLAAALAAKWDSAESGARPLAAILERLSDEHLLGRARVLAQQAAGASPVTYADDDLEALGRL